MHFGVPLAPRASLSLGHMEPKNLAFAQLWEAVDKMMRVQGQNDEGPPECKDFPQVQHHVSSYFPVDSMKIFILWFQTKWRTRCHGNHQTMLSLNPLINDALCFPLFFISFSVREIAGAHSLHFLCTASLPSKITSILQGSFPPPPPPRTPFSWHPVLLMGDVVPFHWWSLRPFYLVGIHLFIYLIIHSSNKHLLNTYSTPDHIFDVRDTKLKKNTINTQFLPSKGS